MDLARRVGVPASTVGRVLARDHTPLLAECDPTTGQVIRAGRHTARRCEHPYPGSLVHIDVGKLGSIPDDGGWRAHGRSEHVRGIGYDYVHTAIDDHSRLAYAEIHPDEKGSTCAGSRTRPPRSTPPRGKVSVESRSRLPTPCPAARSPRSRPRCSAYCQS